MLKILIAILVFGLLILIHEAGHYLTARRFGVAIREFSIGMGPKIVSKTSKKTGIAYSLRWIPFGGYVAMEGEDEESENVNALNRKPVWQRMIIMAAGAAMNLLLGFLLMTAMVLSSKALAGTTVLRFEDGVSTSVKAGLQTGDVIKKVNGHPVHIYYDMSYRVMRDGTSPVKLTVLRDGKTVEIENVTFPTTVEAGTLYGMIDFYPALNEKNFGNVIKHSFWESVASVGLIWDSLLDLLTGKVGVEQVSGPVGVTQAIGEAVADGPNYFLYLVALISINLGVMNLLPFPALDGGRLVFQFIELIRGKPVNPEWEGYIHFAGLAILMIFMIIVTCKDVIGLFG